MIRLLTSAALAATLLAGCNSLPTGARSTSSTEQLVTASATVEAVDPASRAVTLRGDADGEVFTVIAGDEVQNFGQIEAGDRVELDFYEAVAVGMALPEDSGETMTAVVAGRAPEGSRPASVAAITTSMVVEVVSYDDNSGLATIITPDGQTRRVTVQPALRTFAAQRNRGDRVAVTITEAVAVAITEQPA